MVRKSKEINLIINGLENLEHFEDVTALFWSKIIENKVSDLDVTLEVKQEFAKSIIKKIHKNSNSCSLVAPELLK